MSSLLQTRTSWIARRWIVRSCSTLVNSTHRCGSRRSRRSARSSCRVRVPSVCQRIGRTVTTRPMPPSPMRAETSSWPILVRGASAITLSAYRLSHPAFPKEGGHVAVPEASTSGQDHELCARMIGTFYARNGPRLHRRGQNCPREAVPDCAGSPSQGTARSRSRMPLRRVLLGATGPPGRRRGSKAQGAALGV